MNEKADIVTVKGSVIYIKHDNDPWYTACPTPQCNKKVIEGMNGQYSCEKCNKVFDEVSVNQTNIEYIYSYYVLFFCVFVFFSLSVTEDTF